ncbi:MAG TPA: hypothetical protein DCR44_04595 [Acholeplasmatales bacterium]|nr:hypothetical protein [Acholeplasmatales bacterium]
MKFEFTEKPLPKDLIEKRFDQISEESQGRVIFGYVQYDIEAKFNNSVRNCRISHEVYVRSVKGNKFKLPILRVSHGIMPYPVNLSFVDEILKDIKREDQASEWRTITLNTEEELLAFIETIIGDKDFFSIISSIYNMQ